MRPLLPLFCRTLLYRADVMTLRNVAVPCTADVLSARDGVKRGNQTTAKGAASLGSQNYPPYSRRMVNVATLDDDTVPALRLGK